MYNEETKRNNELVWASVFAAEINKQFDFDYTLVPERGENSPVDIYAVSKSHKFPQLKLQLTHAVEIPFVAYEATDVADYSKKPTIDAIHRKCEKLKRQGVNLNELILVIQGYMNKDTALAVFSEPEFVPIKDYDFAGIYYVSPPMLSEDTHESLQDGFLITIKDAFKLYSK